MLQKLGILFAFVLCTALPGQAAVLEVNCNPGPGQFPDINAAVAASSPGDTIAVEYCNNPYPGVSIAFATQLHLVAVEPAGAAPEGVGVAMYRPVTIKEPNGPCVTIDGSSAVTLQGFSLVSCGGEGVLAKNSESIVIEGNRIEGVQSLGIGGTGFGMSILGNHILYPKSHGIYLEDASLAQVSDNFIDSAGEDGISVMGGWSVNLFNNQVLWSNDEGIELLDGAEHRVERNSVRASGADDLLCTATADPDFVANDYATFTDNCGADVYP